MKKMYRAIIAITCVVFFCFVACCACGESGVNESSTTNDNIATRPASSHAFYLKCRADNDLYRTLIDSGFRCQRFDAADEAIDHAPEGAPVLLLADDYPTTPQQIRAGLFAKAQRKKHHLYIEFCSTIPEIKTGEIRHAQWERCVVSTDTMSADLPELKILMINDCYFLPISDSPKRLLTLTKVAGYDRAVFGVPAEQFPIMFEHKNRNLIVATTKLSNFITARYAPTRDWKTIWKFILTALAPEKDYTSFDWTPDIEPCYRRNETLPENVERVSFNSAATWFHESRLLIHESRVEFIHNNLMSNSETAPLPDDTAPLGDGSLGFCEGFSSPIKHNGSQMQRLPIRADCNAEAAKVFAKDSMLKE